MLRSNKDVHFLLLVLASALVSCSLIKTAVSQVRNPTTTSVSASASSQAATPTPTSEPGVSWPEELPPPGNVEEVYHVGVEEGFWSEGEGLVRLLQAFFATPDSKPIPGMDLLPKAEARWVALMARNYVEEHPDDPATSELRALIDALLPSEESILHYSRPFTETTNRAPGAAMPLPLPQAQLNCRGLWMEGFPEAKSDDTEYGEQDLPCFLFAERTVDGSTYRLFLPLDWMTRLNERGDVYMTSMIEAMVKSHHIFKEFGSMQDASVVFLPWDTADYLGMVSPWWFDSQWESCPIMIDALNSSGSFKNSDMMSRTIAHEMFHCFQTWNYGLDESNTSNNDWWIEGGAEYFSNVVFPDSRYKHEMLPGFDLHSNYRSIIEMKYENYVLFQYMANQHSNKRLTEIMEEFPHDEPLSIHQQRLANHVGQDAFHEFGQSYLDQEIEDTGGGMMPIETEHFSRIEFTDETTVPFQVRTFVLERHRLTYKKLRHFFQSYNENTEGRITENLDVSEGWAYPRSDVRSFCSDPDSILLLTTTKPNSNYNVDLKIPRVDETAWDMTTSDAAGDADYGGDHAMYSQTGGGFMVFLSQSDVRQAEPLVNITSGGTFIFETADGTEFSGRGEYTYLEELPGALLGEFTARFWADEWGPLRGDPPSLVATGSFEACPAE